MAGNVATRVGARAYLFCIDHGVDSQDDAAIRRSLAGWPLSAVEALLPVAESAGVTLTRLPSSVPGLHIFSVSG